MARVRIKGLSRVLTKLNFDIKDIQGRSLVGLRKVALLIKGAAQEITPQKTGTLVNSAFSDAEMTPRGPRAVVGYTAKYAAPVHEMPATNVFTKPDTGPQFLSRAIQSNKPLILDIIRKEATVK